jgi:hypothetical protein
MEGNIVGEPIEGFVARQIDIRQQNQFGGYDSTPRTSNQIQYLNNRNAWVKLASSVDILEKLGLEKLQNIKIEGKEGYLGTKLAEKAILFNSLSSFNPSTKSYSDRRANISNSTSLWNDNFAYGIGGTDFGIQPPPGIISVNVDSLNRGSIRKANITLKAYNKFQFDIIEILYLRLGFTMMLEWGWDKFLNNEGNIQETGNTIIEEEWFTSNGTTQLQMLNSIQKKRKDYQGNYDGFFGKVSNFTWNFNTDGSYDISIDLITLGDVIESLKVNTSTKHKFYSDQDIIDEIKDFNGGRLDNTNIAKTATLNTVGYFLYTQIKELSNNKNYGGNNYIVFDIKEDSSFKSPQYYIRLGEFLKQLESRIIPKIQNNNQTLLSQLTFETSGTLISYFPNQIPLDPRVCIFKPSLNSYGDIKGINPPSYFDQYNFADYIYSKEGYTYGLLMNLYVNFEYIAGLLISNGGTDEELPLYKFLQDLCNGINGALGSVNKLEPVIKNDREITIIDQTISIPETQNTFSLEIYGYSPKRQTSNFVKDIKFISKITPQLASMVSIGATAAGSSTSEIDGTAFSKWSEGLVDRFTQEILEPKRIDEELLELEKKEKYIERFVKFDLEDQSFKTLAREAIQNINVIGSKLLLAGEQLAGKLRLLDSAYAKESENKARRDLAKAISEDNDVNEIRIVKEDGIELKAMSFDEYYAKASIKDEKKITDKTYKIGEINELVPTNYGVYLLNAFGGASNEIKIEFFGTTPNQIITGFGSQTSFTNSVKTIKNLQIDSSKARYQEFDDTFISQGKSAYKTYINNLNNTRYKITQTPSSEIGFIPLSFDITLDGISGIKIYNKLNINNEFLPSNYPNSLNFIITKVNHSIANNSWDTSLSTISIPKTEPYKFNTSSTTSTQSNVNVEGSSIKGPQPDNGSPFLILDGRNGRNIITLDNLLLELDPKARPSFRKFFNILKDRYSGYKAIVNSVRRTWEESYNLKFTPNTNSFNPSNAAPGFSLHNYGLAIDINIETPASTTKRKRTLLKRNKTPWIEEGLDKVAIEADLRWGGNFTNYEDCVHFDFYYNLNTAYNQILTQSQNLDSTIKPPFTPFSNGLQKCQKIDKLIKEGKIKLV